MARSSTTKLVRAACRGLQLPSSSAARAVLPSISAAPVVQHAAFRLEASLCRVSSRRFISGSSDRKGITPDDKPPKPKDEESQKVPKTPANITDAQYHAVADEYLDNLLTRLEELQDQREDIEVEYSVRHVPPAGLCLDALG